MQHLEEGQLKEENISGEVDRLKGTNNYQSIQRPIKLESSYYACSEEGKGKKRCCWCPGRARTVEQGELIGTCSGGEGGGIGKKCPMKLSHLLPSTLLWRLPLTKLSRSGIVGPR